MINANKESFFSLLHRGGVYCMIVDPVVTFVTM